MGFSKVSGELGSGRLRPARPLAADVPCSRHMLKLPDGRETLVLRHAAAPAQPAGPAVLFLHGIQSHPGWFVGSAQALARAGCEVFQVTRRGSGEAAGGRGDARSARQLIEDVAAAADYVAARTGADRLAMVGVSWGGKLLTAFALRDAGRAGSLTLVAPGIAPRVGVSAAAKLAIAAAWACCPRRTFEIPLNDVALFTDNPEMRQYLRDDPHRLMRATARLLVASAVLDRRLARARPGALAVPTTLLLARRDRIIDNAATRAAVDRLTGGRAAVVEIDGAHTLEFEPDPTDFHAALCRAVGAQKGVAGPS